MSTSTPSIRCTNCTFIQMTYVLYYALDTYPDQEESKRRTLDITMYLKLL